MKRPIALEPVSSPAYYPNITSHVTKVVVYPINGRVVIFTIVNFKRQGDTKDGALIRYNQVLYGEIKALASHPRFIFGILPKIITRIMGFKVFPTFLHLPTSLLTSCSSSLDIPCRDHIQSPDGAFLSQSKSNVRWTRAKSHLSEGAEFVMSCWSFS